MATEQLVRINVRTLEQQRAPEQVCDFRDGTRAGLRARWSAYDGRWHLWVLALDSSVIAYLGPLVNGVDLLVGHKHDPRVPQGQLFVYSPDRAAPTLETVDVDAVLYYRRST